MIRSANNRENIRMGKIKSIQLTASRRKQLHNHMKLLHISFVSKKAVTNPHNSALIELITLSLFLLLLLSLSSQMKVIFVTQTSTKGKMI